MQALVEVAVSGLHSVRGQQYRRLRRAVYLVRQDGVLDLSQQIKSVNQCVKEKESCLVRIYQHEQLRRIRYTTDC